MNNPSRTNGWYSIGTVVISIFNMYDAPKVIIAVYRTPANANMDIRITGRLLPSFFLRRYERECLVYQSKKLMRRTSWWH